MGTILEDQLREVARFHLSVTGQPFPRKPTLLEGDRLDYRINFLAEEINEFEDATTIGDQADALVDLIYVAYGGLLEMGIYPEQAFRVVHAANMAKVRGKTKRNGLYDAAKPEGWKPPDWDSVIENPEVHPLLSRNTNSGPKLKILLLGYGRHGKDTVAELLRDKYGYSFTSSSMVCAEKVVMPAFERLANDLGIFATVPKYSSAEECFNDRHNHRPFWFQQIEAFNTPDKAALGRMIFETNDVYVGLRSAREFAAVKNSGLYDVCIWVDALQRHPPEGKESCTVEPWMADFILDNNGTLEELAFNLEQLMSRLEGRAL